MRKEKKLYFPTEKALNKVLFAVGKDLYINYKGRNCYVESNGRDLKGYYVTFYFDNCKTQNPIELFLNYANNEIEVGIIEVIEGSLFNSRPNKYKVSIEVNSLTKNYGKRIYVSCQALQPKDLQTILDDLALNTHSALIDYEVRGFHRGLVKRLDALKILKTIYKHYPEVFNGVTIPASLRFPKPLKGNTTIK